MTLRLKVGMHFSCLVHPFSEFNHVNLVTNHPLKKKSARRGYTGIDVQWTLAVRSRAVFFFNISIRILSNTLKENTALEF